MKDETQIRDAASLEALTIEAPTIEALTGKALDQQVYNVACMRLGKTPSAQDFEQGYAQGGFHFLSDAALLGDLIALYEINLHRLGGEWLAFRNNASAYGQTPSEAVCRWLVKSQSANKPR